MLSISINVGGVSSSGGCRLIKGETTTIPNMERVKGQHLHLRRVLDKQLEDLEHDYRQTEAKRDREIRSLGVDLTKLKSYTKDVDQVFTEESPRLLSRRASLPALSSPRPSTSPAIPTLGRHRRLSVVTPPSRSRLELLNASTSDSSCYSPSLYSPSLSFSPRRTSNSSAEGSGDERGGNTPVRRRSQDHPHSAHPNSAAPPSGMTHDDNGRGSVGPAKVMPSQADPARRGSKSGTTADALSKPGDGGKAPVVLKNSGRRGSIDGAKSSAAVGKSSGAQANGKLARRGSKSSESDISHNETKVYVHRDGMEPLLVSKEVPKPAADDGDNAAKSGSSMFGRKSRRASEPALGGHFLRSLQVQAESKSEEVVEVKAHHGVFKPAEEDLRKSIAKDLPSQIVAEEDEDRYNEENGVEDTAAVSKTKDDGAKLKEEVQPPASAEVKPKKPEQVTRRDSLEKSDKIREGSQSAKATGRSPKVLIRENSAHLERKPEKATTSKSLSLQQRRRKSDGDVLRFARIWKLQTDKKGKEGQGDDMSKESPETSKKMTIWDAVRKCRYIRGYNPPDMDQPEDLGEFVFGHSSPDSVVATK